MDACSLRQDQQRGRARWWRSRLCSETGGSEQGHYILRHSRKADGSADFARKRSDNMIDRSQRARSNPAAPAVKREAEEDWGKEKWR